MNGRTSLVTVAHFKWWRSRHATQVTIDAWSSTLLGVKHHSVLASLLVGTCTSCQYALKCHY